MTPQNKLSAGVHTARGVVRDVMSRTGGHGRTAGPGSRTGRSTSADVRRMALKARERLRK